MTNNRRSLVTSDEGFTASRSEYVAERTPGAEVAPKSVRWRHAHWVAAQASKLLSAELGRYIEVRPAMVIYGPTVPWAVTNLRGVDVFSGRKVIRYFGSRKRAAGVPPLTWEEGGEIFYAAHRALPPG